MHVITIINQNEKIIINNTSSSQDINKVVNYSMKFGITKVENHLQNLLNNPLIQHFVLNTTF